MTTNFSNQSSNEQGDIQPRKTAQELVADINGDTYPGRIALRAYAYALAATGNREKANEILSTIGREG